MKQLARKSNHISLVSPATERQSDSPAAAGSVNDFFNGWLISVSSTLLTQEATKPRSSKAVFGKRPLTSIDVARVNRATVRESTEHRCWPPGVVQTFLVADVIKRT